MILACTQMRQDYKNVFIAYCLLFVWLFVYVKPHAGLKAKTSGQFNCLISKIWLTSKNMTTLCNLNLLVLGTEHAQMDFHILQAYQVII